MTVEAGKWYITVECRNPECRHGSPFSPYEDREDVPPPPTPIPLPDTIQLRCFACGQEGVWTPEEVSRSQAPETELIDDMSVRLA